MRHNLWGLDIDERAAQLSYFSVMMKARQYDRRFFNRGLQPHVIAIAESNSADREAVDYFCKGDAGLRLAMETILGELRDAKEYGSILTCTKQDWDALYARFGEVYDEISLHREDALALLPLVRTAEALSQQYDVVVTNPPYMNSYNMGPSLNSFLKKAFPSGKNDLFSSFILRCKDLTKCGGFQAMVTMHSWMFLSRYVQLRKEILSYTLENVLHLGARAFEDIGGEVVQTVSFVIRKAAFSDYIGRYERLIDEESSQMKEKKLFDQNNSCYCAQTSYCHMTDSIIAYWIPSVIRDHFKNTASLGDRADCRQGIATGDNDQYLRLWYETVFSQIAFSCSSQEDMEKSDKLYVPYIKGGAFRRWYGNREYVIKMNRYNYEQLLLVGNHLPSRQRYYKHGITWNDVSTAPYCARYVENGFVFDAAGPMCFYAGNEDYLLGFLNSNTSQAFLDVICQGLHYSTGHIPNIPFIIINESIVSAKTKKNIQISEEDWDSFETSWDFQQHPLVALKGGAGYAATPMEKWSSTVRQAYKNWEAIAADRFAQLKANEEELNRIFIEIYGLQDELTPEVEDKDVTVRKADLQREIRSLISYAVGCMFGRYSIYKDGLMFAGGKWSIEPFLHAAMEHHGIFQMEAIFPLAFDLDPHKVVLPDEDNILPICDDEYFEDDIVGRFVKFIEVVYGKDTLEENLCFIADALGGKGSPRDVIRSYFLNDFYPDHLKTYQKRPIYWLFDSGKKNGFKCLIYMHRYQPDTIARIRTDYVHEQQSRYRTAIADLEARMAAASTAERVKLGKQLQKLRDQAEELRVYEEKIHHLADQMISIDLDDGVKVNYAKFQDVLAKIK